MFFRNPIPTFFNLISYSNQLYTINYCSSVELIYSLEAIIFQSGVTFPLVLYHNWLIYIFNQVVLFLHLLRTNLFFAIRKTGLYDYFASK